MSKHSSAEEKLHARPPVSELRRPAAQQQPTPAPPAGTNAKNQYR